MQFPKEVIEEIKRKVPLEDFVKKYEKLKPNTNGFVCKCLFHDEKTPSMQLYTEKGTFYCYGCNKQGDLLDVAQEMLGLSFPEAVQHLAKENNISLPSSSKEQGKDSISRSMYSNILNEASNFYIDQLYSEKGKNALAYLEDRGVTPELCKDFQLGYSLASWNALRTALNQNGRQSWQGIEAKLLVSGDKGIYDFFRNRIMFPIHDVAGNCIAFGGRGTGDQAPKYMNSPESHYFRKSKTLYGLHLAHKAIKSEKEAFITEGYFDVISLHQYHFPNSVGTMGTAFCKEQVALLQRYCDHFRFLFDGDSAGRSAAFKAAMLALQAGASCTVTLLPKEEDADSLLQSQGRSALLEYLDQSPTGIEYCLSIVRNLPPGPQVKWVKEFLDNLSIPELRAFWIPTIARGLNLSEYEIRQWK